MKILMLDPVWRGTSAMLISSTRGWNPLPPTIARIAPVLVSSVTIAASNPCAVLGQLRRGPARRAPAGWGRTWCGSAGRRGTAGWRAAARRPRNVGPVQQVVLDRLGVVRRLRGVASGWSARARASSTSRPAVRRLDRRHQPHVGEPLGHLTEPAARLARSGGSGRSPTASARGRRGTPPRSSSARRRSCRSTPRPRPASRRRCCRRTRC